MKALTRTLPICALSVLYACGGTTTPAPPPPPATEAEWRALRTPAVEPLPGAPTVTMLDVDVVGTWPHATPRGATLSTGVNEVVTAGLMRRRDVAFVERRRFTPAAEAERQGHDRPAGAPAPGVSPRLDYAAQATWIPTVGGRSAVEIQLVDLSTGSVLGGTRRALTEPLDPVQFGRAIVSGVLALLDEEAGRPAWTDPMAATMNVGGPSGVTPDAIANFFAGVAAEDLWRWEDARRAFQAAAADPAFHEASTLLGRTARLRLGGTLAEN